MTPLLRRKPANGTALVQPVRAEVPELQNAELAAVYYGQRMAGDFYDFVRVNSDRVVFGFLDVAGRVDENRGVLRAMQEAFRTLSPDLFSKPGVNEADAISELCVHLNRVVLQTAGRVHPCPAFAASYNESLGILCYANAGHTPGLLHDRAGISELPATGLPMGLFTHATWDAPVRVIAPGAALLVVSRGVVEGKRKGEEFGLDRVKEAFQESTADTAKELCISLIASVRQFMSTPPTHNDVTALALMRSAAGA